MKGWTLSTRTERYLGRLASVWVVLLGTAACDDPTVASHASDYVAADARGEVIVAFGTSPGAWSADPLQIDSAHVEEDVLVVWAEHGGGCVEHGYAAVAWNGWLESDPVQVGVFIAHEDGDDPCVAILFPELRFDLDALKRDYRKAYGPGAGAFVLRLTAVGGIGGEPTLVAYSF